MEQLIKQEVVIWDMMPCTLTSIYLCAMIC